MKMGPIQLVVFDMAGTTIDDRGNVVLTALIDTARQYDLPGTSDELNALMGMNKIEVFRLLYKQRRPEATDETIEPLAQQALQTFVEHMRVAYQTHLAPIVGAEETFAFLRAHDIKIAIDTGFDSTIGGLVMEQLQWPGRLVDAVVYSSDVARGRPAPYLIFHAMEQLGVLDVHGVMKLGDSPADLEEGYNAGCGEVIGVLSGAHNAETLGRYYHTRLIDSVADLPGLFG
jgi:phosphonatase-like hydrolase